MTEMGFQKGNLNDWRLYTLIHSSKRSFIYGSEDQTTVF